MCFIGEIQSSSANNDDAIGTKNRKGSFKKWLRASHRKLTTTTPNNRLKSDNKPSKELNDNSKV